MEQTSMTNRKAAQTENNESNETDELLVLERNEQPPNNNIKINDYAEASKPKVNRPTETLISQQRLIAWRPLLVPRFVIGLFLMCSLVFLPTGTFLYYNSQKLIEIELDYTNCLDISEPTQTCHEKISKNALYNCKCRVDFNLDSDLKQTAHVYYGLENFYQNSRRYVKSFDSNQLLGKSANDELSEDCEPFRYKPIGANKFIKYEPCGAIANSLFNDSFRLFHLNTISNKTTEINISKQDLAWHTDNKFKYSNQTLIKTTSTTHDDLVVWMRVAAFPSFRKIYGRIFPIESKNDNVNSDDEPNKTSLSRGKYTLDISYRFRVRDFNGRKLFLISTLNSLGGKNKFLSSIYLITGALCLITSIGLLFLHLFLGTMTFDQAILLTEEDYYYQTSSLINLNLKRNYF